MKKIWKNVCLGALAVTSVMGLSGCGKEKNEVSVDLDNDGVVSEWETVFGNMGASDRLTIANVVEINSLSDLKAINDSEEIKVYKLNKDIDCGGETISINLRQSSLYGNNRVIKNFKLADCSIFGENSSKIAKGLFYNGVAVYDLRVFMGNQTYSLTDANSQYTISPFINVPVLDRVVVKGKIDVKRQFSDQVMYLSLLASSIEDHSVDMYITNCSVIGDIDYAESNTSTVCAGGIASTLRSGDLVYNCSVNGDFKVVGTEMNVGLVAGENHGFVSTVDTTGTVALQYYSIGESNVGGVVGLNEKTAEVKNATTNAIISLGQDTALDGNYKFSTGGIAGQNNGIISYSTSDAIINISKCDAPIYIGSVAGRGMHAIYYNVIGRGELNPTNCSRLYIADIVGESRYGYFDKIISGVNIKVDNSAISSKVNLGLITIFENLEADFNSEEKYNAEFVPNFKSILIGGKVNVYTKNALSSGEFKYNLGLRNEFEYFVLDEDGNLIPEESEEIVGGEGEEETPSTPTTFETATLTPYMYDALYILDSYTINKYKMVEGENVLEPALNLTYTKDTKSVTKNSSSMVFQLNFLIRNLGFNYIIGNNEIDISAFEIAKFRYTLSSDKHLERYFRYEQKDYNGELTPFDKEFTGKFTFDINNEMFSFFNKLITSENVSNYTPILVSKEFASTMKALSNEGDMENPEAPDEGVEEDNQEEIEDYLTIEERFATNITEILQLMKINSNYVKLTKDKKIISADDNNEGVFTKYVEIKFADDMYEYTITIDVTEMVGDTEKEKDCYIVYMDYHKDIKLKA